MSDCTVLLGPYELQRRVARSGMGEVWRARHRDLGFDAAVKVLSGPAGASARRALDNEIVSLALLDHPHVVPLLDRGIVAELEAFRSRGLLTAGLPWMATAWMGGGTLQERLASFDGTQLTWVLGQLLEALAHVHARGVVHRDIKPSNLIFGSDGRVRISDFGMARLPVRRASAADAGTPSYMAPEQFGGDDSVQGPWTDLYQVGVVAWLLATGALPFPDASWDALEVAHCESELPTFIARFPLPGRFEVWVSKLLRKSPMRRFRFASDALRSLRSLGPAPLQSRNPTLVAPDEDAEERGLGARLHARRPVSLSGIRAPTLTGRREMREALWSMLRTVHRERVPRVLILEGPSGTGKSRLARWLAEKAHQVGTADYVHATHADVPASGDGLSGLVGRALGVHGMGPVDARERVLFRWADDPVEGMALAALIAPTPDDRFGDAEERYVLTMRVLQRLAIDRPVVVWLDDVQWGADALGLVEHALVDAAPTPLVFVLTVQTEAMVERPVALQKLASLRNREQVLSHSVGPMPARHWRHFLENALGLSRDLAGRLAARAGRNPAFAVEVVRDWGGRGLLRETERGLELVKSVEFDLPRSLAEVWGRRLDAALVGWSDADVVALELAAVLGVVVDVDEWCDVCWNAAIPVPERVEVLLHRRLMQVTGAGWRFVHAMLREVLIQRAGAMGRLPSHHAVCAKTLADRKGYSASLRRARHLTAAGVPAVAAPLLIQSARTLKRQGRLRDAEAVLQDWRSAMEAQGVSQHDPAWSQGLVLHAETLRMQGRCVRAAEIAAQAERLAEGGTDVDRAHAAHAVGLALRDRGELFEGRMRLQRSVELATLSGDKETIASCGLSFGLATLALGDLVGGARALGLVLGMVKDPWVEVQACLGLAYAHIQAERFDEAEPLLQTAGELARRTNSRADVAYCAEMTGELLRGRQQPAEALPHYQRAWREYSRIGAQYSARARFNLAVCLLDMGRTEEARSHLHGVLGQDAPSPGPVLLASSHLALCAVRDPEDDMALHWAHATALFSEGLFVARDIAALAEVAAKSAERAGCGGEASRAWLLAAEQWSTLRHVNRAAGARAAAAQFG